MSSSSSKPNQPHSSQTTSGDNEQLSQQSHQLKYHATSSTFQARYTGPPSDNLTPSQKEIQKTILKSRPNTGLSGPFGPWLSNPNICKPAQELGKVCRYDTSLTKYQSELIILLTAAKHCSHAEFDIHVQEAIDAGIPLDIICAIPRDLEFTLFNIEQKLLPLIANFKSSSETSASTTASPTTYEQDCVLILFAVELLLHSGNISDELYERAKRVLGSGQDEVLVEITSIIGYYTFAAYTLNVFRIPS